MSINNDTNAERGAPLVRSNVNSVEDSIEGRHSDQFDSETETETETELDTDTPFYKTISLPLAELIRPHDLELYTGQDHLVNKENGSIKNFIQLGFLPSMILYGPPGVGKTTIASILARETNYEFVELSATDSTVADLKKLQMEISVENDRRRANNEDYLHIVVFIDEIHRFTKTQQDFLLPYIESGHFVFIGATTVNPKSRIRRAILSRCQMFELRSLSEGEITKVLQRAILFENIRRRCVYDAKFLKFDSRSVEYIVKESSGDSRSAINMIELVSGNFLDGKDLKYVKGDHEPFHVSIQDIRRILSQRRDIGDRKLRDSRNLNLLLKLFDSMRNVFKRREIEDIQRNASTATDNDEDRFDETEADESITDMYTQMDYIPSRVNIYKDENRVVANENDNVPQGKDSSIEESVSLPSLKKVSVGRFDFTSFLINSQWMS